MHRFAPVLVAFAFLTTIAIPVTGHGAPNPLEIEIFVLEDEAEDGFLVTDGYDLFDLYLREASWQDNGTITDGLIFRFSLYGGLRQPTTAQSQTISITVTGPSGPHSASVTTTDDQTWTGDGLIITELETEADIAGSWLQKIQALMPYESFNATVGDTVSDIRMASYVDNDIVDIAPGGHYLPRGGAIAEIPRESTRHVESIELFGPLGYTTTTVGGENGTIEFTVQNPMGDQGQHLSLDIPADQPWDLGEAEADSLNVPAGGNITIRLAAEPHAGTDRPLLVFLSTDIGGREPIFIGLADGKFNGARDETVVQMDLVETITEESPGMPGMVLLAALGMLGAISRRRAA